MTVRRLTAQCLPPLRNKRNSTGDCHAAEFQTGRCRRWVNPDFLLGGRTSASAECRHWSGRRPVGQTPLRSDGAVAHGSEGAFNGIGRPQVCCVALQSAIQLGREPCRADRSPSPLCLDSDQIPHRTEMTRWVTSGLMHRDFDCSRGRPHRERDDVVGGIEERLRDVITLADQHHLGRCSIGVG